MEMSVLLRRPFIHGYELRQGIEALAHQLRSTLGLGSILIQWTDHTTTAGIDERGRMYLAAVRDDARINRPTLVRYVGFVIHELLHRKYTDFGVIHRMSGDNLHFRRSLLNAIEDARIERAAIGQGLLGNIEGVLRDLLDQLVTEARADVTDWGNPMQYPFALAVTCRAYGLSVPMPAQVERIATLAEVKVRTCANTTDALAVAEWVYQQLQDMDENEPQPQQQDDQDDQQGDDQDDQGQQGAQEPAGDDDGEGEGSDQGQGQSAAPGADKGQEKADGQGEGQEAGDKADQKRPKAKRPEPMHQPAREVEPTTGGRQENEGAEGTWCHTKAVGKPGDHVGLEPAPVTCAVPARLRYELRRMFENTAQTLHVNNRKNGRLNPGALARAEVCPTVFRKRLDVEGIDSAVVICLDLSGSMYDNPGRIEAAIPACYALADTLTAAGVNVSVVTFDMQASIAVPFDTPRKRTLDAIARIRGGMQHTNDWAALRVAHDMLHQRHEARRVVFMVSDGCGHVEAMRAQVAAGETLGITTLGVGILLDVSRIYGARNSVTVKKPEDLGNAAFSRMKLAA